MNTIATKIMDQEKSNLLFKTARVFPWEFELFPENIQTQYLYDEESRTYFLPDMLWLEWRKHGPYWAEKNHPLYIKTTLGGSDIASACINSTLAESLQLPNGQHKKTFKTKKELYLEKTETNLPLRTTPPSELFFIGHNEEEAIGRSFAHYYKIEHPHDEVKLIHDTYFAQMGRLKEGKLEFPFLVTNLDFLISINGVIGGLECKTTSRNSPDFPIWKNNQVPYAYYLQICSYMACRNLPYFFIVCKWGLSRSEMTYIYIERDFSVEDLLLSSAKEFVEMVETKQEPGNEGEDPNKLVSLWQKRTGLIKQDEPVYIFDADASDDLLELHNINEQIDELTRVLTDFKEERNKILVEKIFPLMKESSKGLLQLETGGVLEVSLKSNSIDSSQFDLDKLKEEEPNLYANYTSTKVSLRAPIFINEVSNWKDYLKEKGILTPSMQDYCKTKIIKRK